MTNDISTGTYLPHGITQCYLPHGRGDIPAFTPARLVRFSDPGGMQGWVDLVGGCYIPRCYTCLKTVTNPGTNRTQHGLPSFMQRMLLTTMPCHCPPTKTKLESKHFLTAHQQNYRLFSAVNLDENEIMWKMTNIKRKGNAKATKLIWKWSNKIGPKIRLTMTEANEM